jgi:lactoylglutathione lyase
VFSTLYPILATPELGPMLSFYRDLVGATVAYEFRDGSGQLTYVGLRLGTADLGIALDLTATPAVEGRISLWAYVEDCDRVVARLRQSGVTIVDEPADQPWGERMATVRDPDGNLVRVAQTTGG